MSSKCEPPSVALVSSAYQNEMMNKWYNNIDRNNIKLWYWWSGFSGFSVLSYVPEHVQFYFVLNDIWWKLKNTRVLEKIYNKRKHPKKSKRACLSACSQGSNEKKKWTKLERIKRRKRQKLGPPIKCNNPWPHTPLTLPTLNPTHPTLNGHEMDTYDIG